MAARGRDLFHKFKPILIVLAKVFRLLPVPFRTKLLICFRSMKGYKGLAIRYALVKTLAKTCGDNVSIHPDVYLFSVDQLSLGDNISIHPMCYIDAGGGIDIGSDVSVAHATTILSTTHTYDGHNLPIKDQPLITQKTVIEDNVWIGAKVTILCGNTVHSGSVIAAGAVVAHDIPANTMVAGVPARVVKER